MFAEVLAGLGDAVVVERADQGEAYVSSGGHDLRAGSLPDAALIFPESYVANAEQLVLDGPVATIQSHQPLGASLISAQAGDPINHLPALLSMQLSLAREPVRLLESRPRHIALQQFSRLQPAGLDPAVMLDRFFEGVYFSLPELPLPRGKTAPRRPQLCLP